MENSESGIETTQEPRKRKPRERNIPCTCMQCGDEFMGIKGQKFCSSKHRFEYFQNNKKQLSGTGGPEENEETQTQNFNIIEEAQVIPPSVSKAIPQGIPYHAKYVIEHQKEQITELKGAHKKAEELAAKYKADNEALRNQIAEIKIDQKIQDSKGPTGLSGLMESSVMKELMPHVGPALGRLAEKLADAVPVPGAQPAQQQQLAGHNNDLIRSITEWFIAQPEPLQQQVYDFMNKLAALEDPKAIAAKLAAAITQLNGVQKQPNYAGHETNFRFGNN